MDKESLGMYQNMISLFDSKSEGLYDVDMFVTDVCDMLFIETDPQDIEEDDFLIFQEALILLVRDDVLLDHFGLSGLCILHAELMDKGESYYINKVIFQKED